ncbi:MAG TPA: chromosome segregation protein SMC [Phycisphaerales bacterium]|nr:chromosome segregation protein SMC [Phycisphaerales bacterium]
MRLEKIALNGFKSFADKTEFTFNQNITAIVGPNGCGKSNVVDAVKWVLGNQSPKSLRSGQMSDVIFSGSSSRKASGMAEVSLFFSEVTGLGIEQDELQITRRLYRSGDSDYLINNCSCRLKDIRELFMDTGVGVSAYSIIEQGQIDQLLHASKTDRRTIFEEAAGISKYKAHKKEALRKLDRTEQNLLRLADIVSEVGRQLRSIKLQAGKARNYLQYSEKLKELKVNYSLAEYDKLTVKSGKRNADLAGFEKTFGTVVADVARQDALVSELGNTILETDGEINRWDNSLISAKSKIEQQHERIGFLKNRIEELAERKATAAEQIGKLTEQEKVFSGELSECEQELEKNEVDLDSTNRDLLEMENEINVINSECASIEADLEDEKSGIIDIVRRTAQLHNEIQSMGSYRNNLTGQKNRLSGRANEARQQLEGLLTEKALHKTKHGDINSVLAELKQSLDEKRGQIEEFDSQRAIANESLAGAKESRSALTSEFNILSDMEAKREGLNSSIRKILEAKADKNDPSGDRYDYIDGVIADIINADVAHAAAVEAAIEGFSDALVINSTHRFLADSQLRDQLDSRVKVICTDKLEPFVDKLDLSQYPSVRARVVEFVNCDSKYARLAWHLFGRVILVDSLDAAVDLSARFGSEYSFVTDAGEVFNGQNIISAGPVGKTAQLISRKSRLNQLEQDVAKVSYEIREIEKTLEQNNQQSHHLERLCKDFRTAIYEANTERIDTESRLQLLEQNIKRLSEEQPVIVSEIESLEKEITQSVQREHDSRQSLDELEEINTQRTTRIEELEEVFAEKKELQQSKSQALTELKVQAGKVAEQQRSIKQQIASLQSQLQHGRVALESVRGELAGCDDQVKQTERNILSAGSKVSELYVEKELAQKNSVEMHQKVQQLMSQQKETEQSLRQRRIEQAQVEEHIHEVKLDLGQLNVKTEDLCQRISEELQIDLCQAYKNFEQQDVDWDQVREEISQLRGKIERLGNVNVDAIEQQQQLEDRYNFLTKQVEDLNDSKAQLEQLIAKINKESKEKFRVTFEEVRKNFQILFRKLFGGGQADILLEDPDDILESGIEIIARPPGKETRSISLLSGGEKTLTALGLLFAVFRSKPSPFCLLDEVDAALDEANNERFNMIVKEFQKDSQFVIITHSKRTMSIVDILYGVTMQTKGVSKKISVKFDGIDSETDTAVA